MGYVHLLSVATIVVPLFCSFFFHLTFSFCCWVFIAEPMSVAAQQQQQQQQQLRQECSTTVWTVRLLPVDKQNEKTKNKKTRARTRTHADRAESERGRSQSTAGCCESNIASHRIAQQ